MQSDSNIDHPQAQELSGAEIFIEALVQEGVDTVFGYPGGVLLSLYDQLYRTKKIKHVLVRHEQGGTHAADGYARATGKTGVMIATSGPGATNTVTGIATAYMDSIPLVVFTGQVATTLIGTSAFQEADNIGITRPITKHNFHVRDTSELAETIHKAFHIASTGRPGPVVVDLPKDMLIAKAPYTPSTGVTVPGYNPVPAIPSESLQKAAKLIRESKRPVIYVGGGAISSDAAEEVKALALAMNAPVTTTLLGLGAFPESHELSLGMLGMHGTWYANMAVTECDLLIAVGARFDDRITGKVSGFSLKSKKIHIDIDPSNFNKIIQVDVPVAGDVKQVLNRLTPMVVACDSHEWLETIQQWKREHPLHFDTTSEMTKPQEVIQAVSQITNGNAIVTTDVGQHQMWTAQYYRFNHPRSHLSSGGLGTMGYGFPAAMGAAMACPDRTVVAIVGDGGFQMTSMELATAVHHKIPVKIVIVNNGYLGMVRQWQEFFFDSHYSHTELASSNPDFVKMAECYGAIGYRTKTRDEMHEAFEKMMAETELPVVVDVWVDQEENVFPMVPVGAAINEMLEGEN